MILRVTRTRVGPNQVFSSLCDFGFRLHEIDRRCLPDVHSRLVLTHQFLCQRERALLNRHIRQGRLERPIGLLDRRNGLDERLPETQLRRVLVAPGNDMLLPRRIDRAILEERLREREQIPDSKLGSKLASGFVVDVRDIPRHAPRPATPRHSLPDAGGREPVVDTDASIAEEEIRRRRDVARAPERRRKLGNEGTARLGHARDLDLGCETHNRQLGLFSTARRTASFSVRRSVGAGVTCADAAVAPKTAVMIAAAQVPIRKECLAFIAFSMVLTVPPLS